MSASYKSKDTFDSQEFAQDLCKDKNIILGSVECSFREGWAEIFKLFIGRVGRYPILLVAVTDKNEFLEIDVNMRRTTRAKYIYGAIIEAKYDSKRLCAYCGNSKSANDNKFCKECSGNAAQLKTTDTWLDRY